MLNIVITGQQAASFAQVPAPPSAPPVPLDVPASSFAPLEEPPFELLPPLEPLPDPLEPPLEPLLDPLDPLLEPPEDPLLLELSLAAAASLLPSSPPLPFPKPPVLFDEHAASSPKMLPDAHTNLLILRIAVSLSMVSQIARTEPCSSYPSLQAAKRLPSLSFVSTSLMQVGHRVDASPWARSISAPAGHAIDQSIPLMFATG